MYDHVITALDTAHKELRDTIRLHKLGIAIARDALEELRTHVHAHGFDSVEEEIVFFKELKPKIESLRLYHHCLFDLTLGRAGLCRAHDEALLQNELEKIKGFYDENNFLVRYYKSGATYLDDKLFVRAPSDGTWLPPGEGHDPLFTAVCDKFVATIWAYEKVGEFIAGEQRSGMPAETHGKEGKTLKWTDSKAALIELIYALYKTGSINNGQAEIKEIADFLQQVFGVDLGNFYRTIQEIRIRKSGSTNYLDRLKAALVQYMDETDLNYKGR